MEVGDEDGVLSEDDSTWVVGVAIVPIFEGMARSGDCLDGDGCVGSVAAFAGNVAEIVIVGDNTGGISIGVGGAACEFDVVAIVIARTGAGDGVFFRTGVVIIGVVDDGHVVRDIVCVGIEFLAKTGGSARVVVESYNEVVITIVVECAVEDYLVPTLFEMQGTSIDHRQLIEGDGVGVVEHADRGVGHIDGAVRTVASGSVGILQLYGADVLCAAELVGKIQLLGIGVFLVGSERCIEVGLVGAGSDILGGGIVAELGMEGDEMSLIGAVSERIATIDGVEKADDCPFIKLVGVKSYDSHALASG